MLKQEGHPPPPPPPHKSNSSLVRTKTKLHPTHKQHIIPRQQLHPQPFNDPLYEHLDGEVLNREQHNFGPWVEHDRLKSRERARANASNGNSGLPAIYRPQDTTTRYYQQQLQSQAENNENAASPLLPSIRDRNQRAFSLQNLRPASLEFNPTEEVFVRSRVGTKTPFFLKMQGFALPKGAESEGSTRKSNFIYNYCFQETDPLKPLLAKLKDLPRENEHYLKLGKAEPSTNQMLFQELKQHRINKLK